MIGAFLPLTVKNVKIDRFLIIWPIHREMFVFSLIQYTDYLTDRNTKQYLLSPEAKIYQNNFEPNYLFGLMYKITILFPSNMLSALMGVTKAPFGETSVYDIRKSIVY